MKKQLLLVLFLAYYCLGFSQERYWSKISTFSKNSILDQKKNLPRTTLFKLNLKSFTEELSKAPKRNAKSKSNRFIIQIPNHNGSLEAYLIEKTQTLHPKLEAKFPFITSYVGSSLKDSSSKIYFSISHKGFHGMRLSTTSKTEFIEPISTSENIYTIYNRNEKNGVDDSLECTLGSYISPQRIQQKSADDGLLRTYRIAVSTNGEYTQFHGGSKADALAAINTTMTRVNGVFENDFSITMTVIANNDAIIYTNPTTDPYTGSFNNELQQTLSSTIGESAYDIGHLFVKGGNNGNAGCIGCVCVDGRKGSGFTSRGIPEGDTFDIDYVAHEIGHQFGANHTFSFRNEGTDAHFEPGSGSTIMGYAGITGNTDVQNNSDPYFHFFSIEQVTNYVKSINCGTSSATSNQIPIITAGADYTIPANTPFVLTGHATDEDNDTLTYCWEQSDENNAMTTVPNATNPEGVLFRSYTPTIANKRYFPRLETIKNGETSWKWEAIPSISRAINFKLTVRDNHIHGGATVIDEMKVTVDDTAGPFLVSTPNTAVSWSVNSNQVVRWDVANTNVSPINAAMVDIFLSTDGGETYPILLASNTANDGSELITVPNQVGSENRIMVKASNNVFFDISNQNFEITPLDTSDTERPSVPENIIITTITHSSASINWTPSTDNIGVVGYDVYLDGMLFSTVTTTLFEIDTLDPNTSYSIQLRAKDAAGNVSNFSEIKDFRTLDADQNICPNSIQTFPYTQSFETSSLDWVQNTDDDVDWTLISGNTPSDNTGPNNANHGDYYMFLESSSPNYPSKEAILTSPCIDFRNQEHPQLSFNYHMFGANNMGSLIVEISSNDGVSWSTLWSISGNQNSTWHTQSLDLTAYAQSIINLRFRAITGTTWQGDIAIDQLKLFNDSNTSDCTEVTLALTLDDYPEETSWEIQNDQGIIIASENDYTSGGNAILINECLPDGTYTFVIKDSYGDGICCSYGNGSYVLSTELGILASGGNFGALESTTFTIENSSRNIIINEIKSTDPVDIKLSPNPLKNTDNLTVSSPFKELSYEILELSGRIISKGIPVNNIIQTHDLNPGIYIINFRTSSKKIAKKFVKY